MFHLLLATMLQDAAAPAAAGTVTDTYNATQVFFFFSSHSSPIQSNGRRLRSAELVDSVDLASCSNDMYGGWQDMNIIDAPAPRPDQLPMGSSRNTWPNIVNNKVPLLNVSVGVGVCVVCSCVYFCGARTIPELHGCC